MLSCVSSVFSVTSVAAFERLPQPIFALDLIFSKSADASQRTPAVRHRNRYHNLVCAGSIADPHFHAIKMAAGKRGILVPQRNVEHHSKPAALLGRRN